MIYLLVALLCCMLCLALWVNKGDILSPWVISISLFLLGSCVAMLNKNIWKFDMSAYSIAAIVGAMAAFGVGELTINRICSKYPVKTSRPEIESKRLDSNIILTILVCAFLTVGLFTVFEKVYEISVEAGNPDGYSQMLRYARRAILKPENTLGRFCNHIIIITHAVSFIYLYIIINNFVNNKMHYKDLLYSIPVLIYIGQGILSTGRIFIMRIIAFSIMVYALLYFKKNQRNMKAVLKLIFIAFACLAVSIVLFCILGKARGASTQISMFLGAPIANLSEYLGRDNAENPYFGYETLYGVHSILRKFGIGAPAHVRYLEHPQTGPTGSNLYTSLRMYIADYGYTGMLLLQIYLGMFYSILYNFIKRSYMHCVVIFYGFVAFALAMQAIDDYILAIYLSTSTVYWVIYMMISLRILLVREKNVVKSSGDKI